MRHLVVLFLFTFAMSKSYGQVSELGLGVGFSTYWGDMNAASLGTNLKQSSLSASLSYRHYFTDAISLRGGLLAGKLKGDDRKSEKEWQKIRNLRFESPLYEASATLEWNFYTLWIGEKFYFAPYVSAGAGVFAFNPSTDFNGERVELQPLGTEGQGMSGFEDKYSKTGLAILFGGGGHIPISKNWSLEGRVVARRTNTDYIDDLSGNYVNYNELLEGNGPLAAALGNRQGEALGQADPVLLQTGTQRGGESVRDYYFTFMVIVNRRLDNLFGGKRKSETSNCPVW